ASASQALSPATLPSTADCPETETSYRQECPGPSRRRRGKQSVANSSIGALVNLNCSLLIERPGIKGPGPLLSSVSGQLRQFRFADPGATQITAQAAGLCEVFQPARQVFSGRQVEQRRIIGACLFIPTNHRRQ